VNQPSIVLGTAVRLMLPVLLVYSLFLLQRGHHAPGGGFVGGLVAAAAFSLVALSDGPGRARRILRIQPLRLMGLGLLVAAGSGVVGLIWGDAFLQGIWPKWAYLPVIGKIGTPFTFDIGVFMVVLGFALEVFFTLLEDE
jgi:multicomponent Na+:H+ antiporter subunit B